jgi:hypothetical protein
MGGSVHKPMRVANGHSLGRQELGKRPTSTRYWNGDMLIRTILDTTHFKVMIAMNQSEIRN